MSTSVGDISQQGCVGQPPEPSRTPESRVEREVQSHNPCHTCGLVNKILGEERVRKALASCLSLEDYLKACTISRLFLSVGEEPCGETELAKLVHIHRLLFLSDERLFLPGGDMKKPLTEHSYEDLYPRSYSYKELHQGICQIHASKQRYPWEMPVLTSESSHTLSTDISNLSFLKAIYMTSKILGYYKPAKFFDDNSLPLPPRCELLLQLACIWLRHHPCDG